MKICKTCNVLKDLNDYYKHSRMADGHLNTCKECKRQQQTEIRNNNLEYYQEYDRNRPNKEERVKQVVEYRLTEKGKEVRDKAVAKYKTNYPIKYKANNAVNNAVRDNRLTKPNICECCNNTFTSKQIHGHHTDYSKPLEVMWLCNDCHKDWHINNKPLNGDKGLY